VTRKKKKKKESPKEARLKTGTRNRNRKSGRSTFSCGAGRIYQTDQKR